MFFLSCGFWLFLLFLFLNDQIVTERKNDNNAYAMATMIASVLLAPRMLFSGALTDVGTTVKINKADNTTIILW